MASLDSDIPENSEGTGNKDSKDTQRHNPISLVTMAGLCCITHPNKEVIYFCDQHKVDCCEICLSKNHKRCRVIPIEDINLEFLVFLKQVSRVGDNIDNTKYNLELYSKRINSHVQLGETKIRLFFNDIRSKVDEAEKESLKRLHVIRDDVIFGITSHFEVYERLKEEINAIIEEGNALHSKLTLDVQEGVKSHSGQHSNIPYSQSSTKDRRSFSIQHETTVELIQTQMSYINKWSKEMNIDFLSVDESFIDSLVSNLTDCINLTPLNGQPLVPVYEFVEDKHIIGSDVIYCMNIVPGTYDEVLVSIRDANGGTIQHIDANSTVLKELNLPDTPNDFCIDANSIAVTFGNLKIIKLYKFSNMVEYSEILTIGECWGICRANDSFIVTFYEDGLVRNINDEGHVINSSGNIFKHPRHVEVSNHLRRVLVSDADNNRVVVLSEDLQNTLYVLSHPDLKAPRGLCTDTYGSIYICSWNSNSVFKFTSDGKYDSKVISEIKKPYDVCFNKLHTKIGVVITDTSSYRGVIQLYKVVR